MNNRITPLLDYGIAFALLIVVAFIINRPDQTPDTNELIEKALGSDGKNIVIADQMILHLWALDCLPCKRDAQVLQRFHRKHDDYQIIGINIDGQQKRQDIQEWVKSLKLDYEVAIVDHLESNYKTPTTIVYKVKGESPAVIRAPLTYRRLLDMTEKDR